MNIISLKSENVKRLKAVEIKPDGNLVVIGGRNGQGKSSVLDSILYALGGSSTLPDVPIRVGETEANTILEIGDLIIKRTYNLSGNSYLKVENKDGAQYKSPQAILDKLTGSLTFDPLKFSRMSSKEQLQITKQLVGLDFSDLDQQRTELFSERTISNRKVKDLEAVLGNLQPHPEVPEEEVSIEALFTEQDRMERILASNKTMRDQLEVKRAEVREKLRICDEAEAEICRLDARIRELQALQAKESEAIQKIKDEGIVLAQEVKGLVDPDVTLIREQLKNASAVNEKVRRNKAVKEMLQKLNEATAEVENLTAAISEIDNQKSDRMAAAKFPIPGMSCDDNGILLNGLPFEQASSAEQLRASVAMGLSLNPKLKVILVRDGSLLDTDSLKMIGEMATEAGAQIWMERVSEGDEVSVIIEDGMVQSEVANG